MKKISLVRKISKSGWTYCYKLDLLSELFLLSLLSDYFCYFFLIFYDPEFFLFLLSFVDNGYADTV